jgi:rifampicin monooxygenase
VVIIGAGPPTLDEVAERARLVIGSDFGMHSPRRLSRSGTASRLAASYRDGRALLAGDAAHIHAPAGGQGLNRGCKTRSTSVGSSRRRARAGRRPTCWAAITANGASVLANTRAQAMLMDPDPALEPMRQLLGDLGSYDQVNDHFTEMVSGLGVRYDVGDGNPLLGRRMRDLQLKTATGDTTLFELARTGRGVRLDLGDGTIAEMTWPWADRVDVITARTDQVAASGLLLRPDGHVVWVGEEAAGAVVALRAWFGPSEHR